MILTPHTLADLRKRLDADPATIRHVLGAASSRDVALVLSVLRWVAQALPDATPNTEIADGQSDQLPEG